MISPETANTGETLTATDLAGDHQYVLVLLLQSHYCPQSRALVQELVTEYQSFTGRSTALAPVLPDRWERATIWQRRYDLPFELLVDPGALADDTDEFDEWQPISTLVHSLPGAALFEADGDQLQFVQTITGETKGDVPSVDDLLHAIDDEREHAVPASATASDDSFPLELGVEANQSGNS